MFSEIYVNEAIRQAERALAQLQAAQAPSKEQLQQQVIEPFHSACQRLIDAGPGVVVLLRDLLFSTRYWDFSRAQTSARILSALTFPEATQALLEAALSPDMVVTSRGQRALQYLSPSEANFESIADAFTAPGVDQADQHRRYLLIDALGRQTVPGFYAAATQWMRNHAEVYVRRSLAMSLAIVGGPSSVSTLQSALNDRDTIVKLRAAFGLILASQRQHLQALIEAAHATSVQVRTEAITLLGMLTLPEVVQPVLHSLSDSSTDVRMAGIVRTHDVGIREALVRLAALLDDKNMRVAEQAAALLQRLVGDTLPYEWKGRRLTPSSIIATRNYCQQLYSTWQSNVRYLYGRLITLSRLADALLSEQASVAFWNLVSMTGQRFGFDPRVDILVNSNTTQLWRSWAKEHEGDFLAGRWYYLGQLQEIDSS